VNIRGTYQIMPKGRWVPRPGPHVVVRFGEPIRMPAGLSAAEATARVEEALRELAGLD
jgi:1-acyl-sn-glycerol-3-phosphate acyltransferase